jgi:hypothetical protein
MNQCPFHPEEKRSSGSSSGGCSGGSTGKAASDGVTATGGIFTNSMSGKSGVNIAIPGTRAAAACVEPSLLFLCSALDWAAAAFAPAHSSSSEHRVQEDGVAPPLQCFFWIFCAMSAPVYCDGPERQRERDHGACNERRAKEAALSATTAPRLLHRHHIRSPFFTGLSGSSVSRLPDCMRCSVALEVMPHSATSRASGDDTSTIMSWNSGV